MFVWLPTFVLADWQDHDGYPDWCRRGAVRWAHGFEKMGTPQVKLILYCGQNLKQSGRFADEAARELARSEGLKFQPYICSKTIRWKRLFPQFPQLEKCTCLGPDGKRRLMYANPERYAGCYNNPIWLDYIKMRIKETIDKKRPASIFFDNVNFYDCHCDLCRDKFKKYTAEKFGVPMDLSKPKEHPNFQYAKALFQADSTYDFFDKVKAYIRTLDPNVVISPNFHVGGAWTTYLTMRGTPDIVFYEEGHSFPPFTHQVIGYKVGLAASHGKVVGQLLGLPPTVANERALRWSKHWEIAIREAFTYPEEYKLATAEGAACNGTFIPSFCIREQNIYVSDDPHQKEVQEALHDYNAFLKNKKGLYKLAQPGSNIAVLHSIYSRLADRKGYWRDFKRTCRALMDAGIPYEVIIEDDLKSGGLKPYNALLLPPTPVLSKDEAKAILDYAKGGNGIVVLGKLARADRLNRAYSEADLPDLATLPTEERQSLGEGRAWTPAAPLDQMPVEELVRGIEFAAGGIEYRISPPSKTLFVNALKTSDGGATSIHLVNYDFTYKPRSTGDVADDDNFSEARTYLANTKWRARKILMVKDPASIKEPFVRFFGGTPGADFQLVISFNGQDIKTFPGCDLRETAWHEAPVPKGLLKEKNEIVLRVTGNPDHNPDYFNLMVDTTAKTRRSEWSTDEGKTFTTDDISPDMDTQTGEYMVRLSDGSQKERTVKSSDLMGLLQVNPTGRIEVIVRVKADKAPTAMLISPDDKPILIHPQIKGDQAVYAVPNVYIYSVLVIPADRYLNNE
ncbi:MAG: hypothetical protein GXP25_08690 [Planctomycetes bacterium]|nr:hypothetical protein [Planctomycetota bacterium]